MIRMIGNAKSESGKSLFALCDDMNCGEYACVDIPGNLPLDQAAMTATQAIIQMFGFSVSLLGQFCKVHTEQARQRERESSKLVQVITNTSDIQKVKSSRPS